MRERQWQLRSDGQHCAGRKRFPQRLTRLLSGETAAKQIEMRRNDSCWHDSIRWMAERTAMAKCKLFRRHGEFK